MKKEFQYFEKDGVSYPLIEVKLENGVNELTVKALLDSGASLSVFKPEIAEILNLPIKNGKKIYLTGIGGKITGYLHEILVTVGKHNFLCKIAFSPDLNVSFNLLGRNNFFEQFIISIYEKQKKVILCL